MKMLCRKDLLLTATSCRKNAKSADSDKKPDSSDTEDSSEIIDSSNENVEEEVVLESEGDLEIDLSDDEESFGEW